MTTNINNKDYIDFNGKEINHRNSCEYLAETYSTIKIFFDENKIREKCFYFILLEDLTQTIKNEIMIKKLAIATFDFNDVKNYILSIPTHNEKLFVQRGFLKRAKIIYDGYKFIVDNAEALDNEHYLINDLIDSLEKSLENKKSN